MFNQKMADDLLKASEKVRSSWDTAKGQQTIFTPDEPLPVDVKKLKDVTLSQSPRTLCIV